MSAPNPLRGAPRILGALLKLDIHLAQRTVAKYMGRRSFPSPHQKWRAFLRNHLEQMVSVDVFTEPTLTFEVLYVFIVLSHQRCRVLHFNIVESPSASWTAQPLQEAFAFTPPPKYLLRDRDSIFGLEFKRRAHAMGLEEVRFAPRSPWQSPYVERLIGSVRRE